MHALRKMEGDLLFRMILSSLDKYLQLEMKDKAFGVSWNVLCTICWFMNRDTYNSRMWAICQSWPLTISFLEIPAFCSQNQNYYYPLLIIQTFFQVIQSLFSPSIFDVWDSPNGEASNRVIESEHTHPYFPKLPISQSLDQLQGFARDFPDIFGFDRQIGKPWHPFVTGNY